MRVLVTGASGFVGRHLAARLVATSDLDVIALVRRDVPMPRPVTVLQLGAVDANDVTGWTAVVARARPDAIVHLAAAGVHPTDRDAPRLIDVNTVLPATLVRVAGALGVRTVVVAGSSAEYAPAPHRVPITETAPLESTRLYGSSKAAGGLLAIAVGTSLGVAVAVLRLFNVYGGGESSHRLIPSIASAASDGRRIALSPGTQVRDFVEVGDACAAIETALRRCHAGSLESAAYNVSTGVGTTVRDFAQQVVRTLGADPQLLQFGALQMRADDLPWLVGDPARFEGATGWRPARTLAQGIAAALAALPDRAVPSLEPAR